MSRDEIALGRFARTLITRTARRMARHSAFADAEVEDLTQELSVRLLRGLARFDPTQRHPDVFVTAVVRKTVAMLYRERLARKRGAGRVRSLGDSAARDIVSPDAGTAATDQADLADRLDAVLAGCPEKLRVLADQLRVGKLSDAARALGTARSTLQRRVEQLRRRFEDAGLADCV